LDNVFIIRFSSPGGYAPSYQAMANMRERSAPCFPHFAGHTSFLAAANRALNSCLEDFQGLRGKRRRRFSRGIGCSWFTGACHVAREWQQYAFKNVNVTDFA
jgi:hypothetical protein